MSKNWMVCLPRADMEHCLKLGKFGLKMPRLIGSVKELDRVVFYVTKEQKLIGLGEVTKGYYKGSGEIFHSAGIFPHRFDFKASRLQPEIDFRSLLTDMELTKNTTNWGGILRLGIARLPDQDWILIESISQS